MAVPWLQIAGLGLDFVGKLFGGKKKEKTTSEIDYVALRRNAEAAGFNPLTALRAGGGAGFTTTHHPALASGQFIADAMSGLGNIVASIDPMRDASAKLEHQIKQATLANIQADTAARLRSSIGGVPVSTGARNVKAVSPLAKTVVIDGLTYGGSGEGGVIEDTHVAYRRADGTYVRVVNPNLPDADQVIVPALSAGETKIAPVWQKGPNEWGLEVNRAIRSRWDEWTKPWREPLFPK